LQGNILIRDDLTFDGAVQMSLLHEAANQSSIIRHKCSFTQTDLVNAIKWERSHKNSNSSCNICYACNKPGHLREKCRLEAVIRHDPSKREIIHCASRVLTTAEKSYSNIQKEALAVFFEIKRFHQYFAGRKFIIQTDHVPLRFIFDS
jgi:hypothetical protein